MTTRTKKTLKWSTTDADDYGNPHHYFLSSAGSWRTGTNLDELIASFKRERLPFNAYRVDLPEDATYQIVGFRPYVPDDQLHWIAFFEPK